MNVLFFYRYLKRQTKVPKENLKQLPNRAYSFHLQVVQINRLKYANQYSSTAAWTVKDEVEIQSLYQDAEGHLYSM